MEMLGGGSASHPNDMGGAGQPPLPAIANPLGQASIPPRRLPSGPTEYPYIGTPPFTTTSPYTGRTYDSSAARARDQHETHNAYIASLPASQRPTMTNFQRKALANALAGQQAPANGFVSNIAAPQTRDKFSDHLASIQKYGQHQNEQADAIFARLADIRKRASRATEGRRMLDGPAAMQGRLTATGRPYPTAHPVQTRIPTTFEAQKRTSGRSSRTPEHSGTQRPRWMIKDTPLCGATWASGGLMLWVSAACPSTRMSEPTANAKWEPAATVRNKRLDSLPTPRK